MIFIETPIFTEDVTKLLSEDEYRALQNSLAESPDSGDVIQGTGGLRKVRWGAQGKGKRGGVRVIYYHIVSAYQIRLILIYQKGIKDDLTEDEKKVLSELNKGGK
jgi:mRNA-degrading endonuclease RelE of RelBE toxin-antitoxin system